MAITPTGADLGRRVKLKQFNGPMLYGELTGAETDYAHDGVVALVIYDGDKFPIRTDVDKLDWA